MTIDSDDSMPQAGASPGGRASSAPLIGRDTEPTLFELSHPGRKAWQLRSTGIPEIALEKLVPEQHRRSAPVSVAEVSERDLVGHFTRLSHRQYSVDLGAYPLGSCTMKYNPKFCDAVAILPGLCDVHPGAPDRCTQGWLELLVELEETLCEITGMAAATLQPAAGAAGELTGLLLMRAWHSAQGRPRTKVVIPDSAHGTNPASVSFGGFEVVTVASNDRGLVDLDQLRSVLDEDVAGIMLTNPNTLGLFEEEITEIAAAVHDVGGLLYYDGANLNAIVGMVRPGDMGFDIVHLNLHKTFATPHGGGGPGAGPVAVSERLVPFLPGPRPVRLGSSPDADDHDGQPPRYGWDTPATLDRQGPLLARQRPRSCPRSCVHRGERRRRVAARRQAGRAERQLVATTSQRRLRHPVRPPLHARARPFGFIAEATKRGARARRGETSHRRRISLAHRLLPAHRRRGAHDRADRDGEPADLGSTGSGIREDRCRRGLRRGRRARPRGSACDPGPQGGRGKSRAGV